MQLKLDPLPSRPFAVGLSFLLLLLNVTVATTEAGQRSTRSKAAPAEQAEAAPVTTRYDCPAGLSLTATISPGKSPSARIEVVNDFWVLPRAPSASGTRYSDGKVTFLIKGESARFESPDLSLTCLSVPNTGTGSTSLTATAWKLVLLSQNGATTNVPAGLKVDATFEDGRVSGAGVCNRYFASFRASPDQSIAIGEIGATLMMCPDHAELERQFLRMLKASTRYDVRNGVLELSTPDGSLRFVEVR